MCIVEGNSPTPVFRQFNFTQEDLGTVILGVDVLRDGINVWEARSIFQPSIFHL